MSNLLFKKGQINILKEDVTTGPVREAFAAGTIESYLNHVSVRKNDLFFIEAGTVHAIGAGCLMAEIQESSNITYRLYDYDRVNKYGCKRPLHIDKALEVANLLSSAAPRQPMRVLCYNNGSASELLTRCKYFQVERLLPGTRAENSPPSRSAATPSMRFCAWTAAVSCTATASSSPSSKGTAYSSPQTAWN